MDVVDARAAPSGRATLGWIAGMALAAWACAAFVDRPVSTWSHDVLHRPALAVAITHLAEFRVCLALALAALLVAAGARLFQGKLGPALRIALAMALAMLLSMVAVILLKYACGRLWPETWVQHNPSWIAGHAYGFVPFHGGEGWGSFPSGHTARTTAPFAVLWQRVPAWAAIWAVPPLVIAGALVACDFHFVGDCVAGAAVGLVCAALVRPV